MCLRSSKIPIISEHVYVFQNLTHDHDDVGENGRVITCLMYTFEVAGDHTDTAIYFITCLMYTFEVAGDHTDTAIYFITCLMYTFEVVGDQC